MSDEYNWAHVQVRLIDLANAMIKGFITHEGTAEKTIEVQCKWFDQTYKALLKTVVGEQET